MASDDLGITALEPIVDSPAENDDLVDASPLSCMALPGHAGIEERVRFRGRVRSRPASSMSVSLIQGRSQKEHPLLAGMRFAPPTKDTRTGTAILDVRYPVHAKEFEARSFNGVGDNTQLPKSKRVYFSRPASLPELKAELSCHEGRNAKDLLRRLSEVPEAKQARSFITPDAGAPVCPDRHKVGGEMNNRDGQACPWNNRFHTGIAMINEDLHPSHRGGFGCHKSIFEMAPSQQWRRQLDVEVAPGEWKPIATRRPVKFGPIGI
eukprot:TRINITY_DN13226_c0_g1_i1.p1 TRINITY_DN13226_c0_g1~~TRINITY_DN13226_c0_g1_i1.p1  ORF type:complete len:302 (+),score=49.77 TRINITY_DN13226_c0_g1_i1:113-907(+)